MVWCGMEKPEQSFVQRIKGQLDGSTRLARAEETLKAAEKWFDDEFGYITYQEALRKFFEKNLPGLTLSDADVSDLGKDMVLKRDSLTARLDVLVLRQFPSLMASDLAELEKGLIDSGNRQRNSEGRGMGYGIVRQLQTNLRDEIKAVKQAERIVDHLRPLARDSGWRAY